MAKDQTSEFASTSSTAVAGGMDIAAVQADTSFFGHPRGLSTLFFTEMWERFSYYGMRAILILFMTAAVADGGLGFDTARAGAIYGLYTALAYMMALPGGWVADRILGQRKAVLYGGILIAIGNFSLVVDSLATFYAGLALIILGTGLLKPNVSTMVGELYPREASARRDAGFSIFYMGINLGAFLAPLVAGFLGEKVNWHMGFAAAGVGMLLGIIQYVAGGRHLGPAGLQVDNADAAALARNKRNLALGLLGVGIVAAIAFMNFEVEAIAAAGTAMIVTLTVLYFAYVLTAGGLDAVEKKRVVAIFVLFLSAAIFWAGFEQAGSSLNLVTEQLTDRNVFGWEVPASWLQSVNPLFIIALAPVFGILWIKLSRTGREPSSPGKFAFGHIFLGLGFAVMIFATSLSAGGAKISPMWLILTYMLHTLGELALSPVGLSTVTKLAPHKMVGQMMGIWFMAASLGNLIAGQIAGRIGAEEAEAAGAISPDLAVKIFTIVTIFTLGYGLLLAIVVKPVRKLMGGVH